MKFIILTIFLNWSAVKYGSEADTKTVYIKATQVSAIRGEEDYYKDDKRNQNPLYTACKVDIDGKMEYVFSSCEDVVEEVNKGLSK